MVYSMRRYKIAQVAGKKMRLIRRKKKLSQEEVSELAGIHVSTYGRIERGENNPPLQTVDKIARALKVKPSELL